MGARGSIDEWFFADLGRALHALARRPALTLISLLLAAAPFASLLFGGIGWGLGVIAVGVVTSGFDGTQRVWFLRAFRGEGMPPGDVERLTARFVPRFLLLGLTVFGAWLATTGGLMAVFRVAEAGRGIATAPFAATVVRYSLLATTAVADVAWTFVTPALAFSTTSVRQAYRIGWRMMQAGWPGTAWYVLAPGLALMGLTLFFGPTAPAARYAVAFQAWSFALTCKGAAVAYYDRHCPGLDTGGATVKSPGDAWIRVRNAFDPPSDDDGLRVLIDGDWPSGLDREEADLDAWFPELVPSADLTDWLARFPVDFPRFVAYYRAQLGEPRRAARLHELQAMAEEYVLTLLTAAADLERSPAAALAAVLRVEPAATVQAGPAEP
ncbi:MAG TPA: DUF488 family protein [Actinomycetota bacterium]|nr:DUF488 family protein [Actinomycetota bacterium]